MSVADLLAWAAAVLVVLSVSARDFRTYRIVALGSNVLFIAFGIVAGVTAILTLHVILLAINVTRLVEIERTRRKHPAGSDLDVRRVA